MRPSQTILVLEDLRNNFSGPLYRKGVRLSLDDSQTVYDTYQQWLALMLDLGYLHHGSLKRDAQRLWSDMIKMDVLDLNNAFADLLHLTRCQSSKGFKAPCSRISSHLFSFLKNDIEQIPEGDVYSARRLIQLFSWTSRLSLKDVDLEQQCLEDYMAIEDDMSSYMPRGLTSSLNKIIREWMSSFDPDQIQFGHGPGGVAGHGRTALQVKYKDLASDALLSYAFGDPYWVQSSIPSNLDRISQTIFVPKSYKTFRTISMESSTLQYCQQGVLREIERVVATNFRLKSRIDSRDQPRNQRLAKEGSFSRNYATIDLSAASDSVSYSLVKKLFRGTKLLRFLIATRSPRTLLPDGRLIKLKKFAPMGSALCFPIETIIFAAVCHYVTREHGVTGDYSVYGDDIIVPTQCAEDLMLTLNILNFSVNRDKSFYDKECWFRESCGAEYCDGFDVTPIRVSRKYNHKLQFKRMQGLVKSANAAYSHGYSNLRHFFVKKMRTDGFTALFSPTSLLADNYTNYHAQRRWNQNLQRIEVEATTPVLPKPKVQDEFTRYRHWIESTATRQELGDGFVSRIDHVPVLIKNQWFIKPYEQLDQPFIDHFKPLQR